MLGLLKKLFGGKQEVVAAEVPYKVEAPTPVAEKATQAVVESIAPAAEVKAQPKKKAAPKPKAAPAVKKPAAPKKPRAPKTKA